MYSPMSKYFRLGAGVFFTVAAGSVLTTPSPKYGLLLLTGLGMAGIIGYGFECKRQGAQPLTTLKPGTYFVDSVIFAHKDEITMAIRWHVDYGHYEYRFARLKRSDFDSRVPQTGDEIKVSRQFPGTYFVRSITRPVNAS